MGTQCKYKHGHQVFSGKSQFISGGGITANQTILNSTTETVLITDTLSADVLETSMQFRMTLAGTISSDGTDDLTLQLRFGTTDVLAFTTVSYPNEDDKAFWLDIIGRCHTEGASGKMVAGGILKMAATGMADQVVSTAAAGVSVDTTAEAAINLTGEFDDGSADTDIIVHSGIIEYWN